MAKLTKYDLQRRTLTEDLGSLDSYSTYTLKEIAEQYGEDVSLSFDHETGWSEYDSCSFSIKVLRIRLETDDELNSRIDALKAHIAAAAKTQRDERKARKMATEMREREEYERLRAKFEE